MYIRKAHGLIAVSLNGQDFIFAPTFKEAFKIALEGFENE